MENNNYTIALLIDTENVSSKYLEALKEELNVLGKVTYLRMYGDFTLSSSKTPVLTTTFSFPNDKNINNSSYSGSSMKKVFLFKLSPLIGNARDFIPGIKRIKQ